jgi:hypothetical protein
VKTPVNVTFKGKIQKGVNLLIFLNVSGLPAEVDPRDNNLEIELTKTK